MPIKFRCDHCDQFLGISRAKAGSVTDCPTCGRTIRVPNLDGTVEPLPDNNVNLQDFHLAAAMDELARMTVEPSGVGKYPADTGKSVPAPHLASTKNKREAAAASKQDSFLDEEFQKLQDDEAAPSGKREQARAGDLETISPVVAAAPAPVVVEPVPAPKPKTVAPVPSHQAGVSPSAAVLEESEEPIAILVDELPKASSAVKTAQKSNRNSLLLVGGTGIALAVVGFLVGVWWNSGAVSGGEASQAAGEQTETQVAEDKVAVQGRISYIAGSGESRPDAGARIFIFPEERIGSIRIPAAGFRPGDDRPDFEITKAAFERMGGFASRTNETGEFELAGLEPGSYQILVVSRYAEDAESEQSDIRLQKLLELYFTKPDDVLGSLAYAFGKLSYKGTEPLQWDYTFDAKASE